MNVRTILLSLSLGFGALILAAMGPDEAQAQCCAPPPPCCAPPPPPPPSTPPCCTPGHNVNVPGVNVYVAPSVVVTATAKVNAAASASGSASGQTAVFFGGSGGGNFYSPPMASGVISALNVQGGKKQVAYEATRTKTKRVVIQAVCIDDRLVAHAASQISPDKDILETYEGELYRCIAGTRLQVTISEYFGKIDFSKGETLGCKKGEALYHSKGKVECRPQKPGRNCFERSLLRRFGAGVKILTITVVETYTAYREEQSEMVSTSMSLDGGVGGIVY